MTLPTLALIFLGWIVLSVVAGLLASAFFSALKRNQR